MLYSMTTTSVTLGMAVGIAAHLVVLRLGLKFGGLAFPVPIKKAILIAPTVEIDQEPRYIKYVPTAHLPSDLIYAVRVSRFPDSKWSLDVGTGHVGATLAQGINIKVNNAVAFAADFRF